MSAGVKPGRIGTWRLLDILTATMTWRAGMFMPTMAAPEYGPPDARAVARDPDEELPDSNITPGEQQRAMQRESARRDGRG